MKTEKVLNYMMTIMLVVAFGFWMKAIIDYDHAVDEYIEVIRKLPTEQRAAHYDAIQQSMDRLSPSAMQAPERKERKKNDVIDDYVEMKVIGAL